MKATEDPSHVCMVRLSIRNPLLVQVRNAMHRGRSIEHRSRDVERMERKDE